MVSKYVDLGLPSGTLWATCNVGATKPEDYGDFFAWGETTTKDVYSLAFYKWKDGYTSSGGKSVLDAEDDAATANWGVKWRMPTSEEIKELLDNTTSEMTTLNGVSGCKFTAKDGSDNFIFLPAAGSISGSTLELVGSYGFYWSSSVNPNGLYFTEGMEAPQSYNLTRSDGLRVRPVVVKLTGIAINATNFPDINFRSYLLEQSYGEDGILTDEEIAKVTRMYVYGKSIANLTGIEHFTALTDLRCYENKLTSLDVSKNTALTYLDCCDNDLTELDLSKNIALNELWCFGNRIHGDKMLALVNSLPTVTNGIFGVINTKDSNEENVITKSQVDIAKSKGWKSVRDWSDGSSVEYAGSDDPTGIEINETNFPDANFRGYLLEQSYGADGILTDAEIAAVFNISVEGKSIENLAGIEHFTVLTSLNCNNNQLSELNVSANTALTWLECARNQLSTLDVSANTELTTLNCNNNQLTKLDVSANTALRFLHCYDNQLTKLDVSANTALVALECSHNQLTKLDVSANTALETLECHSNQLTKLSVSQNRELIWLDCSGNQLSKLSVFDNAKLTTLDCDYNQLTELDVSENTKLVTLECCNNQLTSLAVLHCNKLTKLRCYGNQIKGDKMQALVVSLQEVEGGEKGQFYVKNTSDENDGNEITTTQVGIATDKNWEVMCVELHDNGTLIPAAYEGSEPATNLTYEMKIEPGVTLLMGEKILDYAALILTAMAEVFDVEDTDPITFKSKGTGEMLMMFGGDGLGMIWVSADVSSADNVSFDITDEMRTQLIGILGEDWLLGYNKVSCTFVELPEKKDFILSLPKKVNTFEELNIVSEAAMEVAAIYALQCWGELLIVDEGYYTNKSGKRLFDVDGAITLFDNVGPDDNIVHIITEQDRTDFMELAKMPFDYFVAYKSIQIRFGVEATKDFIYTFTKKETVLEEDSEAAAALMAVRSFAMDDLMPDYTCTVEKVGENPATFTLKHKDKTLFATTTNDEGQDIVVVGDEVSAADNFTVSISNEMRGKMSEGCQELLAEYKTLQFRFEMGGSSGSSGGGSTTYYSLAYTATEGGYIKGSINQSVKQGQSGTEVEAVANEGYRFVKWSDGLTTVKRIDTNVQKNISVTAEFEKTNTTGIFNSKFESLSVYPNPTQGAVQVEATGTVLVSNVAGQLLQRVASQGKVLIDLSGYPDGIYFISVGNAVAKVVKR